MFISDITPFTFQDFPDKTACIIWFAGCNFRCPYCHNPEFISINKGQKYIEQKQAIDFLKTRKGLLDGVVLSGGECTLNNEIYNFIKKIKELEFLVKIDTNGTNPILIKKLINEHMIDFIALDYKAPKDKYIKITQIDNFNLFNESLEFLCKNNFNMEIRTTIHTKLLIEDDINEIIKHLEKNNYRGNYVLQNFKNTKTLTDIGEQERKLNKNLINSKNINIMYRNF
jgi:pyruvate formate lyase activating enzyme